MKFKEFLNLLKKDKEIIALCYTGSRGINAQDKYSDADMLALISNNFSFEKFSKKYSNLNVQYYPHPDFIKNLKMFSIKTEEKLRVEVEVLTVGEYNKHIKEKSIEKLAKYVRNIKILYDPKGIFKKSKKVKYPEEKGKFLLRLIVYPLRIKGKVNLALERGNHIFIDNLISQTIEIMIKIVYVLNKREYLSIKLAYKELKKIKKKPKNFEKRINNILKLKNKGKELNKKLDLIHKLGNDLYKMILKKYPEMRIIDDHIEWAKEY